METECVEVFGFIRTKGKKKIYVIANSDFEKTKKTILYLSETVVEDIFTNKKIKINRSELALSLKPGEVKVFVVG